MTLEEYELEKDSLMHYGIIGMKWGYRRFQNGDGTLTPAGKARYGVGEKNKETRARIDILEKKRQLAALKGKQNKVEKLSGKIAKSKAELKKGEDKEEILKSKESIQDAKLKNYISKKETQRALHEGKKAEKHRKEMEKILKSNDPDKILNNLDKMSAQEIQQASDRINKIKAVESLKKGKPILQTAEDFVNNVSKGISIYNKAADIVNDATGVPTMKKIGGKDEAAKKATKREFEKAVNRGDIDTVMEYADKVDMSTFKNGMDAIAKAQQVKVTKAPTAKVNKYIKDIKGADNRAEALAILEEHYNELSYKQRAQLTEAYKNAIVSLPEQRAIAGTDSNVRTYSSVANSTEAISRGSGFTESSYNISMASISNPDTWADYGYSSYASTTPTQFQRNQNRR